MRRAVPHSSEPLRQLAVSAAQAAADVISSGAGRTHADATKSSATDLVTEMDRRAERTIIEAVLTERPQDAILAEETGTRSGTSGFTWVIDPIDGTTNYVYGLAGYTVSVAVEDHLGVIAAAVVDPARDETFSAGRGQGAQLDGEPLEVGPPPPLAQALVATGFAYESGRRRIQAGRLPRILPAVRDIRRVGSAAGDLCAVAAGRVDAYFEDGPAWWDLAAGSLIVTEAGARFGTLDGTRFEAGALVLACHPAAWSKLAALIDPPAPTGPGANHAADADGDGAP